MRVCGCHVLLPQTTNWRRRGRDLQEAHQRRPHATESSHARIGVRSEVGQCDKGLGDMREFARWSMEKRSPDVYSGNDRNQTNTPSIWCCNDSGELPVHIECGAPVFMLALLAVALELICYTTMVCTNSFSFHICIFVAIGGTINRTKFSVSSQ